jgi:CopG family nickel-responsive transcriptional regulator
MKSGVTRLSVSLPSALVKDFDTTWQGMKYTNRSKAVHDALRNFVSDHRWMQQEAQELMGAIVLVYYMDKRGLINRIMEIQHSFENVISSTMHVHLTKDKCLEIIGVRGNASDAKALAQRLMAVKGVKQLKFATMIP